MGLLDRLDQIVPGWAIEAPRQAMETLLSGPALVLDAITELVVKGRKAAMPGQVLIPGIVGSAGFDNFDALPFIARDRLVFPGLTETPWVLAARLRRYRDDWALAGTAYSILQELARVLGPTPPMMRIFTTGGNWSTLDPDGTFHFQTSGGVGYSLAPDGTSSPDTTVAVVCDWDSVSLPVPPDQGDGSRGFLVIYPPYPVYLTTDDGIGTDDGEAGDLWNNPDVTVEDGSPAPGTDNPWAGTCGSNAPWSLVVLIRGVLNQRACAGYFMAWIIIAFDSASFAPDGSSGTPAAGSAYPDGNWAWHTKFDSGTNSQIPARNSTAEYWPGVAQLPYQG